MQKISVDLITEKYMKYENEKEILKQMRHVKL